MNYDKFTNYTIHWSAKVLGWQPLELPAGEPVEPEITDLSEANEVLSKIMSM